MEKTNFKWKINTMPKTDDKNLPIMNVDEVEKAKRFHKSFSPYNALNIVHGALSQASSPPSHSCMASVQNIHRGFLKCRP